MKVLYRLSFGSLDGTKGKTALEVRADCLDDCTVTVEYEDGETLLLCRLRRHPVRGIAGIIAARSSSRLAGGENDDVNREEIYSANFLRWM